MQIKSVCVFWKTLKKGKKRWITEVKYDILRLRYELDRNQFLLGETMNY